MDCRHIDVDTRQFRAYNLVDMLAKGRLTISDDVVDNRRQCEFIEGLLIDACPKNMVFVFDEIKNGDPHYNVIDGKKRIQSIAQFLAGKFPITKTEFLNDLEGKAIKDLPISMERTILDTVFNVTVIRGAYRDPEVVESLIRRFS